MIGAGPVGITIARELARCGPVLLVEGGGPTREASDQGLSNGEVIGMPYALAESRARGFGGTSHQWAGWCATFDPVDFERRDWVAHSGWPLREADIVAFHERAADVLNVRGAEFDAARLLADAVTLPFDPAVATPSVWRFGTPTVRFAEKYRAELEESNAISVVLHASVVDVRLDRDHGRITGLILRTPGGRDEMVSADIVVLAGGGIENARLLLNSDAQVPAGIGNSGGWVGRCFMEHPHWTVGAVELDEAPWMSLSLATSTIDGDRHFMLAFGITPELQRAERLLNARAHAYRTPDMADDAPPRLGLFMEQAPNPASRAVLADSTDAMGMRRVRLDWQFDGIDVASTRRTAQILGEELVRCGAARWVSERHIDPQGVVQTNHHVGTTRMSATAEEGVVDRNCRVHDIENLYVAGSSVFPTSSWANPTYTAVALAIRLADHLRPMLA